jgi:diguanylate cyclase (GGDEF)-like protein
MVDITNLERITPTSIADKRDKGAFRKRTPHDVNEAESDNSKPDDFAFIMDFPAEEMTPKVEAALSKILNEFNCQREELAHIRDHALFLEKQAEYHEFLPILSKHALVGNLSRIMVHSERASLMNGFVYLHIRNLGKIRRLHGHQAADHVLIHAANILQNDLRESDVLGSLGGDDFGIILTVTDAESVKDKALELTKLLEAQRVSWEALFIDIVIWTGIHIFRSAPTPEEIIEAADKILVGQAGKPFVETAGLEVNDKAKFSDEELASTGARNITSADVLLTCEIEALSSKQPKDF